MTENNYCTKCGAPLDKHSLKELIKKVIIAYEEVRKEKGFNKLIVNKSKK